MERYECVEVIGEGSFGFVFKATDRSTGETVAVKKMKTKFHSWHQILTLNEISSQKKMNHPNIVKLNQVIRDTDHSLYVIFEFMESDLIRHRKRRNSNFSEPEIKNYCFQLLSGLTHMHQQGYFHRDLKPDNLLVTQGTIKIADLGLAKGTADPKQQTEIVGTLWYRAPEMVFRSGDHDSKVDMWALGVIMAEMFVCRRILAGKDEADQMNRICKLIGSPNRETWPEGFVHAERFGYRFPLFERGDLREVIPNASEDALSLIELLCSWNPRDRPTAVEALQHRFFSDCFRAPAGLYRGPPPGFGSRFDDKSTETVGGVRRCLTGPKAMLQNYNTPHACNK